MATALTFDTADAKEKPATPVREGFSAAPFVASRVACKFSIACPYPVSYTHLDVYKRQSFVCLAFNSDTQAITAGISRKGDRSVMPGKGLCALRHPDVHTGVIVLFPTDGMYPCLLYTSDLYQGGFLTSILKDNRIFLIRKDIGAVGCAFLDIIAAKRQVGRHQGRQRCNVVLLLKESIQLRCQALQTANPTGPHEFHLKGA